MNTNTDYKAKNGENNSTDINIIDEKYTCVYVIFIEMLSYDIVNKHVLLKMRYMII